MNFSTEEQIDMIWILGECNRNCLLSSRIYQQRFPERRHPHKKVFERLKNRFNGTGSVVYEKHERRKTANTELKEFEVLLAVTENPNISTHELSRQYEISQTSAVKILHKYKMHPYHIQLHQELNEADYRRRLAFCEWAQQKIYAERFFFDFVLFGDEATFHKNGTLNRHNFHYYATTNPHLIRPHSQTRWSINVWGGIVGNHVIGPHFFDGRVNGEVYHDFLENHLPLLLEGVPANIRERMWFLHDGAPVHHTAQIHNHPNQQFPARWLGRGGLFEWPPRSPDLTKMDFFMWGYIKNRVYQETPTTAEDMKNRIREAFNSINGEMLRNVSQSFESRLQSCIEVQGGHFEHLY